MSAVAVPDPSRATALRWLVSDSLVLARRNLAHVRQIPEKLIDVTLQPLMFVLLFAFVFGGVIHVPGGNYREYLIGGILVQTLAFGIIGPATSIATDLTRGHRRPLPLAADVALGLPARPPDRRAAPRRRSALAVLTLTGLIVGWRIHTDPLHAIAGFALLVLFAVGDALARDAASA